MSSVDKSNPNISRPRPLIKRAKSMATRSSVQSGTMSTTSRPDSAVSAASLSSSSGKAMMQYLHKVLNTPISDPNSRRSSLSDRSSIFSRFRRVEGSGNKPQPIARMPPNSSLRDTTRSLLSDYSTFRNSIISLTGSGSGRAAEATLAAAKEYYTSVEIYLAIVDALPSSVRDTLEVKRSRQQLEFTSKLLQPVTKENQSEQTIVLLDNTLVLVRNIISDVQYLLLQQRNPPCSVLEEDEPEDDASSAEEAYEYDTPEPVILINSIAQEESHACHQVGNSIPLLNRFSKAAVPSRDTGYSATGDCDMTLRQDSDSNDQPVEQRQIARQSGQTQKTLADLSRNIIDVADSLTAIKALHLFAETDHSESNTVKPDDTVDITYGQDGIPVAMSPYAIMEQLIKDLGTPYNKHETSSRDFTNIIFTTFRFFWKPEEFLQHLEDAYDESYYNDRKLSVILLVRTWVLAYWLPQDTKVKSLIMRIQRFLGKALTDGLVCSSIIIDILERLKEYALDPGRSAIVCTSPELQYESMPWSFKDLTREMPLYRGDYQSIRILQFNTKDGCSELAKQLTLQESRLYLQLSAREIISCFVKDDRKQETAAREKLKNLREFSCTVKRWAAWNVLSGSTPMKRAKTFSFMMRLARVLLGIRNFSSAHAVFNGALSVHLDILDQTEAEITLKARKNMAYITKFFEQNKDISMQSSAQPTVPIMATYAGKLSRLLEAKGVQTKSKVDGSVTLVNISFFTAATRITYAMESNQHPYDFKAHKPLQAFIDHTLQIVPGEEEIHELYLKVKGEEQSGVYPVKAGLIRRLRTNSLVTFPKFQLDKQIMKA